MINVLFICTANMERSPTAENVFSDVKDWSVKSAGTDPYAINTITSELIKWADKIIVMQNKHLEHILKIDPDCYVKTHVLGIENRYHRCSGELIGTLIAKMSQIFYLDEWIKTKFNCN